MSPVATALDIDTASRLRVAIGRLSRRLRTTAAGSAAGLTPTRISVLLTVVRQGPIRLSELAERMRRERTDAVNEAMKQMAPADRDLLEKALPALEQLAEHLKDRRP